MSDNSKLNQEPEYFFGELKKIELSEDDTAGVFSYIAPPSPGSMPLGYPLGPALPVMVAPRPFSPSPFRPFSPISRY